MTKHDIIEQSKQIIKALIDDSECLREQYDDMNCAVYDAKLFIDTLKKESL